MNRPSEHRAARRLLLTLAAALLASCSGTGIDPEGFSLSSSPLIGKFVWHDLMSDDLAASQAFYGPLLGWTFEQAERPNGGPYLLARAGRRYVAGLIEVADPPDGDHSRWLGYLSVSDVDQALSRGLANGASVVLEARQVGQIGRAAVIRDPEGAPLGLLRVDRGDPDDERAGMPGSVGWNELLAADPVAAVEFYRILAGYEARRMERRNGAYHLLSDGQRDRAGIFLNPLDGVDPNWLTHFVVEDIARAAARVEPLGGKVLLAPSTSFRDGRVALVTDPAGAILVLRQAD